MDDRKNFFGCSSAFIVSSLIYVGSCIGYNEAPRQVKYLDKGISIRIEEDGIRKTKHFDQNISCKYYIGTEEKPGSVEMRYAPISLDFNDYEDQLNPDHLAAAKKNVNNGDEVKYNIEQSKDYAGDSPDNESPFFSVPYKFGLNHRMNPAEFEMQSALGKIEKISEVSLGDVVLKYSNRDSIHLDKAAIPSTTYWMFGFIPIPDLKRPPITNIKKGNYDLNDKIHNSNNTSRDIFDREYKNFSGKLDQKLKEMASSHAQRICLIEGIEGTLEFMRRSEIDSEGKFYFAVRMDENIGINTTGNFDLESNVTSGYMGQSASTQGRANDDIVQTMFLTGLVAKTANGTD